MTFAGCRVFTMSDPSAISLLTQLHRKWMSLAIAQARLASDAGDVPIGCVVVHEPSGEIFEGHNRREQDQDPAAHAEIVAMRRAAAALKSWRLVDCTLVVTLEPCPMCAGAIVNARIPTLVFGCPDPKAGAAGTLMNLCDDPRLNHRAKIIQGVEADACGDLLRDFFRQQRALGKK